MFRCVTSYNKFLVVKLKLTRLDFPMWGVASTYVVGSVPKLHRTDEDLQTETDGQNFSSKRHLLATGSDIMSDVRHRADSSDPSQIFVS